jgi:hypothetical protein
MGQAAHRRELKKKTIPFIEKAVPASKSASSSKLDYRTSRP